MGKFCWVISLVALATAMPACSQTGGSGVAMERLNEVPALALPRAVNCLELKTEASNKTWNLATASWEVDLDRGVIEFRNDKGWLISAPVEVIGTYNTLDGTFMWGWDHPSVPEQSAHAAKQVLAYGKRHGISKMTTRVVKISEKEAWQFTALADYLTSGNGAYRGPTGKTHVFMTFGEVTISKK